MGFSDSRRAEEDHIRGRLDEREPGELTEQPLRDARLEPEVEALQPGRKGQAGSTHAALLGAGLPFGQFGA
jgi:hypothetical protein